MRGVNLKLLHTFLAVAELGSFRRAAEETGRSPSAVSMQIRDLEGQIGAALFHRRHNEVVLTEGGRLLHRQVERAMADVEAGLHLLSDEAARRRGRVTLGCAPTLATTRLPSILATFKARHPDCAVHLREASTAHGLELLHRGEIEFYLGPSVARMEGCAFEAIVADPLLACMPACYDRGGRSVPIAFLSEVPLIMLSSATALRATVDALLEGLSLSLSPQFEVEQTSTALALAAAGLGVALLPRIAAPHALALQLRVVPLTGAEVSRQIGIISVPGQVRHEFSEKLMALVRVSLRSEFL